MRATVICGTGFLALSVSIMNGYTTVALAYGLILSVMLVILVSECTTTKEQHFQDLIRLGDKKRAEELYPELMRQRHQKQVIAE